MEINVRHLGNVKFEATARGHRVVSDQPPENGGGDSGMTPPEYLLISLGTCAGFYAAQYLKLHKLSTEGLEITVSAEKAKAPARLGSIRMEVALPALDENHEAGLLRAVDSCLIRNTLAYPPSIETVIRTAVLA